MADEMIRNGETVNVREIEDHKLRQAALDYLILSRVAWADRVFGYNAKCRINECVKILRAAGFTHVHNIFFGDTEIKGIAGIHDRNNP